MPRQYGLPYKGSKSKIAAELFCCFPKRDNFYDLFAGGCAMTHYALANKNYKRIIANDINPGPVQLFMDAIHGKFHNEKRWISRDDFYSLKDKEPYVRYVWSFGNNGADYLYAKEVEPWKKALHFARVLGNFDLFNEFGIRTDGTRKDIRENQEEYKKLYIKWYMEKIHKTKPSNAELEKKMIDQQELSENELREYLREGLRKAGKRPGDVNRYLGTNGMAGHYFGKSQWEFPTKEIYEKLQSFLHLPLDYDALVGVRLLKEALTALQRLQSLQSLESLERLQRLESRAMSYDEIPIEKNSLVYCDIPYAGTDGYGIEFNHKKFYEWCARQTEPVFISSYDMPEEKFYCVKKLIHRSTLSSTANLKVVEKLFIPRHQAKEYELPEELFSWQEMNYLLA